MSSGSTSDARRRRWGVPERGSGPAFALSLLAHAALFIAIAFVVRWKTEPAGPISAELWSALPPPVVEAPAPRPAPIPVPPPPPPRVEPEPVPPKADIVVAPKKVEPVPPKPRPEPPPPPPKEVKKVPPPPDPSVAAKREAAEKAAEAKAAEAQRQAAINRDRALASAGPSAPVASAGAGLSRAYQAKIIQCIRPNLVFIVPEGIRPQQHVAEFEVQLLPTGEKAAPPRLLKGSGLSAYDQAVERAILSCKVFPKLDDGTMPPSLRLSFDPIETR